MSLIHALVAKVLRFLASILEGPTERTVAELKVIASVADRNAQPGPDQPTQQPSGSSTASASGGPGPTASTPAASASGGPGPTTIPTASASGAPGPSTSSPSTCPLGCQTAIVTLVVVTLGSLQGRSGRFHRQHDCYGLRAAHSKLHVSQCCAIQHGLTGCKLCV